MKIRKMCYDRLLPWEQRNPRRPAAMAVDANGKVKAIMPIGKRWPNGTELHIRFLGGTDQQQHDVANSASEWTKHANLKFTFDDAPDAQIRISFQNDGAWSYLGTDNLDIPFHAATMNFGWLDEGTVLHEFGHALGLAHEHSSPMGGIQWNREVVLQELAGPPNFWSEATVEHNVFFKYDMDHINGTEFDRKSIMLYAFPDEWTLNNAGTSSNDVLSELDKAFIGAVYPKAVEPETVELPVNETQRVAAAIGEPGEEDQFHFEVADSGRYIVETHGDTDLVMKLFGPDDGARLIDEDDDSGQARNSKIDAQLSPGKYLVHVRHYRKSSGMGEYSVSVRKES